jgi:hypothetical protein
VVGGGRLIAGRRLIAGGLTSWCTGWRRAELPGRRLAELAWVAGLIGAAELAGRRRTELAGRGLASGLTRGRRAERVGLASGLTRRRLAGLSRERLRRAERAGLLGGRRAREREDAEDRQRARSEAES